MVQINATTIEIESPLGNKVELIDLSARTPNMVAIRISNLGGGGYKMTTVNLDELRQALRQFKLPVAA